MIEAIYKGGITSLKVKGTLNENAHEFAAIIKHLDNLGDVKVFAEILASTMSTIPTKKDNQENESCGELTIPVSELIKLLNEMKKAVIEYACRK